MNIGFIGTGSMGSILIESFIASNKVNESNVYITNRTIGKAHQLKERFPAINLTQNTLDIVANCHIIFLCMKPAQIPAVAKKIAPHCNDDQIVISITSPISVSQLESIVTCKVVRVIPTILNRALTGSSLISFSKRCTNSDRHTVTSLMNTISDPLEIEENITRVSSDIVSCGPAFFSYLTEQFIQAAVRQTDILEREATELATNMLIGIGKLLEEKHYTLPTLQKRVCVPGGITGEGIKALEGGLGDVFDQLFQQTHKKYNDEKKIVAQLFEDLITK